jgi:hypothetical protein
MHESVCVDHLQQQQQQQKIREEKRRKKPISPGAVTPIVRAKDAAKVALLRARARRCVFVTPGRGRQLGCIQL